MKVASVIIDNSSREVDKEFDYYIPEELELFIDKGSSVVVPFGLYNSYKEGYVIDIKDETSFKDGKLKKIADILDEDITINKELLELSNYIKEEYLCTLNDALRLMTPPKKLVKEVININFIAEKNDLSKRLKTILDFIKEHENITLEKLQKEFKHSKYKVKIADLLILKNYRCIDYTKDFTKKSSKKEVPVYILESIEKCEGFIKESKKAKKQVELVKNLLKSGGKEFSQDELIENYSTSKGIIDSLVNKEILIKEFRQVYRSPIKEDHIYKKVKLTDDQERVIENTLESFKYGKNTVLIHGVTGSGKTEIYLNLVERFINEGYGSIVMVPEIALTPQTVERFHGRFGDTVAIVHSRLSDGERYDQFRKIKNGEYKVVVGARSAVFSPVKDLKLIIIDEEHEASYKSENSPRYLVHDIAKYRINKSRGLLILGSATPSIESYYKAQIGEYSLEKIDKRIKDLPMPKTLIVNMKEELLLGNKSMFSRALYNEIKNNLSLKDQTILFLNRRGHSTFVSCRSCGYVCECESCSVTLTYHNKMNRLKCHHCGRDYIIPTTCPKCKSKYIKYFGVGTEKVQKEVERYFNTSSIVRMDIDTTRKIGSLDKIYKEFKNRKKDILIGTQMVAKGMDFEGVTLVGVISADISLNIPDFRASERTFQLLTQVSGRAGRGDKEGRVVIQTYNPTHFAVQCASKHDYESFYNEEIKIRRLLNYPPFSKMMHIVFVSEDLKSLESTMNLVGEKLKIGLKDENVVLIGPSPCQILKIKDKYRWHVIIKGDISSIKDQVLDLIQKNVQNKDIGFMIDIDPYTLT